MYKLTFPSDKTKEQVKAKARARADTLFDCRILSLEDRRRRLRELKANTECRACGRKGNWAHDRECAMPPSSSSSQNQSRTDRMMRRQHLSNQVKQVGMCFVLNDYSDDPDTSAFMVGQNVPLPKESARQTPLTSDASTAVDTEKCGIFDAHHG